MNRGKASPTDSLEMLLDTITNTFGGILFLTILVAILVQFSGKKQTQFEETKNDERAIPSELEFELQTLLTAVEAQEKTIADFRNENSEETLEEILQLSKQKQAILNDIRERTESDASVAGENIELAAELEDTKSQLQPARDEEKTLKKEVRQEIAKRTQTARLPSLRTTQKSEFPTVMRYGRLYFLHATKMNKLLRQYNKDEFIFLSDKGDIVSITPKPYAGLIIDDSLQLEEELGKRLLTLEKQSDYLAIAISEDSFDTFKHLRRVLVQLGWEYRLIPLAKGEVIQETAIEEALVQ